MFISRTDRLDLTLSFTSGTYETEFDPGLVAEYLEVTERYQALMRKLWEIHEEARKERLRLFMK
jgi:hypothetical protein